MRYPTTEYTYVYSSFPTESICWLDLYQSTDNSLVALSNSGCTEMNSLGIYKWSTNAISSYPSTKTEYLWVMNISGSSEKSYGKLVLGGYPDNIFPSGDIITHGDINWAGETGVKSVVDYISSNFAFSSQVKIIDTLSTYISSNFAYSSQLPTLQTHGDSTWSTATGFATSSDFDELESEMDYVSSQIFPSGDVINHGDVNWLTASGFSTHSATDASSNINNLSTHTASDVWSVGSRDLTDDTPVIDWISSQVYLISTQVGNVPISSQLGEWHGVGSWTTGAGGGSSGPGSVWISSQLTAISTNSIDIFPSASIITHGDNHWMSSNVTNLSTHSATDVWTAGGRELSTPNNYKANLTELEAEVDYISSQVFPSSSIITHGDSNWTTGAGSGGGGGSVYISSQLDYISSQVMNVFPSTAIIVHGDTNWSAAGADVSPQVDYISSQLTWASSQGRFFPSAAIIDHGDVYWSAGGGTATQDMVSYISSNMALSSQIEAYGGGGGGAQYVVTSRKSWHYKEKMETIKRVESIQEIVEDLQRVYWNNHKLQGDATSNMRTLLNDNLKSLKSDINILFSKSDAKKLSSQIKLLTKSLDSLKDDTISKNVISNMSSDIGELCKMLVKILPDKYLEELENE